MNGLMDNTPIGGPELWSEENLFEYVNFDDPEVLQVFENVSMQDLEALEVGLESFDTLAVDADATAFRAIAVQLDDRVPLADGKGAKRDRTSNSHCGSNDSPCSTRPKKRPRKIRFSAAQTDILETWLICHQSYPYPQRKEKEELAHATNLTVEQIQAWFARVRQRRLQYTSTPQDPAIEVERHSAHDRSIPTSNFRKSPNQSRTGSSAALSRGAAQSSLAVIPASPHPSHLGAFSDDSKSEPRQSGVREHEVIALPSGLSLGASKVQWWLEMLPAGVDEYDDNLSLPIDHTNENKWDLWPFKKGKSSNPAQRGGEQTPEQGGGLAFELPFGVASLTRSLERASGQYRSQYRDGRGFLSVDLGRASANTTRLRSAGRGSDNISISSSSLGTNRRSGPLTSSGSYSAATVRSYATSFSSYSFDRRRGRRIVPNNQASTSRRERQFRKRQDLKYYCTFCSDRFQDKFRWQRHEESQHAPQKSWVCRPMRPRDGRAITCPLCYFYESNPQQCLHDMQPCWARPVRARTFLRKDNLVQHLEGVHNARAGLKSSILDEMTEGISEIPYDLTCHFCKHQNSTWKERASHIAQHFEAGMTMESWKPPEPDKPSPMDQIQPYVQRLSRIWDGGRLVGRAHGTHVRGRSPSPLVQTSDPRIPNIVIQDYTNDIEMDDSPRLPESVPEASPRVVRHDSIATAGRNSYRQDQKTDLSPEMSEKRQWAKRLVPRVSLGLKIGSLFRMFSRSERPT